MKSLFVPLLPIFAVLAVIPTLPKVMHPFPKPLIILTGTTTSNRFQIHLRKPGDGQFVILFNNEKLLVSIPYARQYIDAHCTEDQHDGDGNSCYIARIIVAMAEHDYEVLP